MGDGELEGPRIDLGEDIAGFDHLSFRVPHMHERSGDLRLDHRGRQGCDCPEAGEDDREIAADDLRRGDGGRRSAARAGKGSRFRGAIAPGAERERAK